MVRCANGHENPDGQRFCGECGQALDGNARTESGPLSAKEAPVGTADDSAHASRWSWLRSRAAVVIGVWVVVVGVVLFVAVVPFHAHKTISVTTTHSELTGFAPEPCPVHIPGEPRCTPGPEVPTYKATSTVAHVSYSRSCRAAITDAFRSPSALPTGDGTQTASEADITRVKYACHDAAATRLWIAGAVFVAAIIGTWLFFNLAPSPRKRKRANADMASAS